MAAEQASGCGTGGALAAGLYGGVRASIDWNSATLECDGMPRPNGEGARLRFAGSAGTADGVRQPAFILGLPGLFESETTRELPPNVTVIEEGTGRFFGTRDAASCWTDIEMHEQIEPDLPAACRISGILYCVAPLADLNGNSSISFADLKFAGRLDWKGPK